MMFPFPALISILFLILGSVNLIVVDDDVFRISDKDWEQLINISRIQVCYENYSDSRATILEAFAEFVCV